MHGEFGAQIHVLLSLKTLKKAPGPEISELWIRSSDFWRLWKRNHARCFLNSELWITERMDACIIEDSEKGTRPGDFRTLNQDFRNLKTLKQEPKPEISGLRTMILRIPRHETALRNRFSDSETMIFMIFMILRREIGKQNSKTLRFQKIPKFPNTQKFLKMYNVWLAISGWNKVRTRWVIRFKPVQFHSRAVCADLDTPFYLYLGFIVILAISLNLFDNVFHQLGHSIKTFPPASRIYGTLLLLQQASALYFFRIASNLL